MKWYFACSEKSETFYPLIKAAVNSALKNTTLKPNFIFDGKPNELTAWLESKGVNIIYHKVSFCDAIYKAYPKRDWFCPLGAYLRCEIPIIENDDEIVLYTDCDVVFLKDINEQNSPKPKYFSCSSQFDKWDFIVFNTGVMFMNIPNLRKTHDDFVKYIVKNIRKLPVFDQSAFQFYYGAKNEPLDIRFNHKPYWGIDENAFIVHYHGPKPYLFANDCELKNLHPKYFKLYKKNPEAYDYYLELFKEYLPEINYDYAAISRLKSGQYQPRKIKNPFNIRIKNFLRKNFHRIKNILFSKS